MKKSLLFLLGLLLVTPSFCFANERRIHVLSNGQSCELELTFSQGPELNLPFAIKITIAKKETCTPKSIEFDAIMPDHGHGINYQYRAVPVGGGEFVIKDVILHMPGTWSLFFDLDTGRTLERAEISIDI